MTSTLIIVASALTMAILAAPAFAGQGYGNGRYGAQQATSSASLSSHADASPKTRAEVQAELKAYRDSGQPNKDVYRGN